MITESERTIIVKTYHCDFCDFCTEDNTGCCGYAPIMLCHVCGKHACSSHRRYFSDEVGDYPEGIMACAECEFKVSLAWKEALIWYDEQYEYYEDPEHTEVELAYMILKDKDRMEELRQKRIVELSK